MQMLNRPFVPFFKQKKQISLYNIRYLLINNYLNKNNILRKTYREQWTLSKKRKLNACFFFVPGVPMSTVVFFYKMNIIFSLVPIFFSFSFVLAVVFYPVFRFHNHPDAVWYLDYHYDIQTPFGLKDLPAELTAFY